MANPAAASIQPRATHARRGPAATNSANAAVANRPQAAMPAPAGPGVETQHVGERQVGMEHDPERRRIVARVDDDQRPREQQHDRTGTGDHGCAEAAHRRTDAAGQHRADDERECRDHHERGGERVARGRDAVRTTSPTQWPTAWPAGASAVTRRRCRDRTRRRATINRSRNGASAKNTSGPKRPSAIALRATGFTAYAIAVTRAGPNVARCDRASR